MGQTPVCTFCSDNEKDIELKSPKIQPKIFFSQNISSPGNSNIILKEKNFSNFYNLTYIGGYTTAIKEGFGILRWENNSEFKGNFHNGVPTGWGIYYNPKMGKYNGEYEDNKRNGYGIFSHIIISGRISQWRKKWNRNLFFP